MKSSKPWNANSKPVDPTGFLALEHSVLNEFETVGNATEGVPYKTQSALFPVDCRPIGNAG